MPYNSYGLPKFITLLKLIFDLAFLKLIGDLQASCLLAPYLRHWGKNLQSHFKDKAVFPQC